MSLKIKGLAGEANNWQNIKQTYADCIPDWFIKGIFTQSYFLATSVVSVCTIISIYNSTKLA